MAHRLGFACKHITPRPHKTDSDCEFWDATAGTAGQSTTRAWLNKQTPDAAHAKLWSCMQSNIAAAQALVALTADQPVCLRLLRLGSDLLPLYSETTWHAFYRQPDVVSYLEKHLLALGNYARQHDVRLSFHPGQFTVLASDRPEVVQRSIEEFEYHADMARYMGYGRSFQDMKINVHISGKAGPAGIRAALKRMSPEARSCMTIENEEISWGLDAALELQHDVALVLDVHHHWINTGEYISARDDRIARIQDSWRGVIPTMHFSTSRRDALGPDHADHVRPDLHALMAAGIKKSKLRAHSFFMWNRAVNDWALEHAQWANIMLECKSKNIGQQQFYQYARSQGIYA